MRVGFAAVENQKREQEANRACAASGPEQRNARNAEKKTQNSGDNRRLGSSNE
jgi:hypothetical protein